MSRGEFIRWAVPRYKKWFSERPGERPSVDRIDSAGHYESGNIRLVSLSENSRWQKIRPNLQAPAGYAWCGRCRRYYPRSNFYQHESAPHGLQFVCKKCSREGNMESRRRVCPTP